MAGTSNRASGGIQGGNRGRRSLQQQPQEEEDEFAMAAMAAMGISDGYQPSDMSNSNPTYAFQPSTTRPGLAAQRRITPPPRPSSASKPQKPESFALRHDGAMGHLGESSSAAGGSSTSAPTLSRTTTRSSSISSVSEIYVRPEEPYSGPTAPSFNYQMHPQQSRDVRASIATTIARTERSYQGPSAPVHPYGMYPQNTAPESVSGRGIPPSTYPAGFPGRNNQFQRRLGPDGEEVADMIGPDGYTEQLPPYTQYPDEAFARKARLAESRSLIPGAGGLGLATRDPQFASREDLSRAHSQRSMQSIVSTRPSTMVETQALEQEPLPSEKKKLKKWQVKARKKVCGIVPLWSILMALMVLLIFVIILAVTLVLLKPKMRKDTSTGNADAITEVTLTKTIDAVPFTTVPAGLSTLPTGTYALPISAPSAVQNSCLLNPEQSKGWSCSMPQSPLQMQIIDLPGGRNELANKEIILDYGKSALKSYPYGTQPPVLLSPQVLNLVVDNQDTDRGPAWFFQTIYNKVVIVPEDLLASPYDQKRDLSGRDGHSYHVDDLPNTEEAILGRSAQVGQTPWFCYWNGTLLEAFLYVNQTSSEAGHGAAHSSQAQTSTLAPSTSSKFPTYVPTKTTPSFLIATATSSPSPTSSDPWGPEHEKLSAYPKVLKFQERRIPQGRQAIPPYCVKRYIAADGTARDLMNSTGKPVMVFLSETVPEKFSPMKKRSVVLNVEDFLEKKSLQKRGDTDSDDVDASDRNCGCAWLAT